MARASAYITVRCKHPLPYCENYTSSNYTINNLSVPSQKVLKRERALWCYLCLAHTRSWFKIPHKKLRKVRKGAKTVAKKEKGSGVANTASMCRTTRVQWSKQSIKPKLQRGRQRSVLTSETIKPEMCHLCRGSEEANLEATLRENNRDRDSFDRHRGCLSTLDTHVHEVTGELAKTRRTESKTRPRRQDPS